MTTALEVWIALGPSPAVAEADPGGPPMMPPNRVATARSLGAARTTATCIAPTLGVDRPAIYRALAGSAAGR